MEGFQCLARPLHTISVVTAPDREAKDTLLNIFGSGTGSSPGIRTQSTAIDSQCLYQLSTNLGEMAMENEGINWQTMVHSHPICVNAT